MLQTCCNKKLGIFVVFVTQLGTQGFCWVTQLDPKPNLGPRFGPKTQPKAGLGWVGSGSNWVVEKSSLYHSLKR